MRYKMITNYKGEYEADLIPNFWTKKISYIENFCKPDLCRCDTPIINEVMGVDMGGYTEKSFIEWCQTYPQKSFWDRYDKYMCV